MIFQQEEEEEEVVQDHIHQDPIHQADPTPTLQQMQVTVQLQHIPLATSQALTLTIADTLTGQAIAQSTEVMPNTVAMQDTATNQQPTLTTVEETMDTTTKVMAGSTTVKIAHPTDGILLLLSQLKV